MSSEPTERHSIAVGSGRVRADARFVAVSASRAGGTILVVRSRGPFPSTPSSLPVDSDPSDAAVESGGLGTKLRLPVSGTPGRQAALQRVPNWLVRRLLEGTRRGREAGSSQTLAVQTRRSPNRANTGGATVERRHFAQHIRFWSDRSANGGELGTRRREKIENSPRSRPVAGESRIALAARIRLSRSQAPQWPIRSRTGCSF